MAATDQPATTTANKDERIMETSPVLGTRTGGTVWTTARRIPEKPQRIAGF
jgi:hypothetical protein